MGGDEWSDEELARAVEEERAGVYVASKTKYAEDWRAYRDEAGYPITASWIDECHTGSSSEWWAETWRRCLREAADAGAFVLYAEEGDTLRGAMAELGAALLGGVPCFICAPSETIGNLAKHPLVETCRDAGPCLRRAQEALDRRLRTDPDEGSEPVAEFLLDHIGHVIATSRWDDGQAVVACRTCDERCSLYAPKEEGDG